MSQIADAAPRTGPPPALLSLRRVMLIGVAVLAASGVLAGLARLGILPGVGGSIAVQHGPLLVVGVFVTLIALERAVALGGGWALMAPGFGAAGGVAALLELGFASWLSVGAAALMVVINGLIVLRQRASFTMLMLLGSIVLTVGTLAWAAGAPVRQVLPAWLGFFVLTITAERLELSRLSLTPRWASRALLVIACALTAAALLFLAWPRVLDIFGVALIFIGLWQLRYDLARRTLRQAGLPRFAALGVLSGATWLVVSGGVIMVTGLPGAGGHYDAAVHGVLVGYVLAMVFAHAPIILPAVARVRVVFTRAMYVPLVVLHAGLVLRVAGDLHESLVLRQVGAAGNALALVFFAGVVISGRWRTPSCASR